MRFSDINSSARSNAHQNGLNNDSALGNERGYVPPQNIGLNDYPLNRSTLNGTGELYGIANNLLNSKIIGRLNYNQERSRKFEG